MAVNVTDRVKDAFVTALVAALLALPLAGVRTEEGIDGVVVQSRLMAVAVAAALVFVGRLCWGLAGEGKPVALLAVLGGGVALLVPFPTEFLKSAAVGIGVVVGARFVWAKLLRSKGQRASLDLCLVEKKAQQEERGSPPLEGGGRGGVQKQGFFGKIHSLLFLRRTPFYIPHPQPLPQGEGSSTSLASSFRSRTEIINRILGLNSPLSSPAREGEGILLLLWARWFPKTVSLTMVSYVLIAVAVVFPFTPLANRYALDVAIMVLTYIMLAWGLNITVGYAGLLDLGYAGFYALGAYGYALLAQHFGIGFWACLPIAGLIAAVTGLLLGAPVLRLRGDYFAVVTLGFGEIVRLVLINWTDLTGGPNGISDIPRPKLFGLEFVRHAAEGQGSFSDYFHLDFDPVQRVIFLYFVVLLLALLVGWFASRLRRLPLGRAWESFREDEIACASLGINRTWIKLAAYSLGAMVAGLAGAFFAARQGFVSPESFTFTESATILAIVILGGIGHPLGIVLAALFVIGLPELFRGFEQYRMIAFGLGMVLIMVGRPGGMMATREPTVKLADQK